MWPNLKETAGLVTFTEDILNGKLLVYAVLVDTDAYSNILILFRVWRKSKKANLPFFPLTS